jgi:hypothetical protein
MNCSRMRRIILSSDVSRMRENVRVHAVHCPTCRRLLEETTWTCQLIALKRYEHPAASAEQRCLQAVRLQVRRLEAKGRSQTEASRFDWLPTPNLVYASAMIGVVVLGIMLVGIARPPSLTSTLPADAVRVADDSSFRPLTQTADLREVVPPSEFSAFSNQTPLRIQRTPPTVRYVIGPGQ